MSIDEHDDEYHVSEETKEEMGVFQYTPYLGFLCFAIAGVLILGFNEVFYGIIVAVLGGGFGALYKFSFFIVKAKQLVKEHLG